MNRIFKVVWNKVSNQLEVVSELAKSNGKTCSRTNSFSLESQCIARVRLSLLTVAIIAGASILSNNSLAVGSILSGRLSVPNALNKVIENSVIVAANVINASDLNADIEIEDEPDADNQMYAQEKSAEADSKAENKAKEPESAAASNNQADLKVQKRVQQRLKVMML